MTDPREPFDWDTPDTVCTTCGAPLYWSGTGYSDRPDTTLYHVCRTEPRPVTRPCAKCGHDETVHDEEEDGECCLDCIRVGAGFERYHKFRDD